MDNIFDEDGKDEVVDGQIGFDELIIPETTNDEQPKYVPPIEGQVSIDTLPSLSVQNKEPKFKNNPKEKKGIANNEKNKTKQEKPKLDKESQEWLEKVKDKESIEEIIENKQESQLYKDVHGIKTKKEKDMKEEKTTPYNSNGGTSDGLLYKAIDEVLHESMIPYSEHVIMDRALPRVEDGLKPVQRRILYSMIELGVTPDKPYRKSARIVGDCMGKYHPHGDSSVYDAMVRLAQPFNTNGILIDGHGNFGSVDGDSAAAMRYTEARLAPLALELLRDLEKDTVHWSLNFDDTLKEPDILPGRFPNLLVNGCQGIAVGLATNIPPHNLSEVIDGVVAYIDNNNITLKEMLKIIKGPDFPTGGFIINGSDLEQIYETGKGKIIMRAKLHIEDNGATQSIVITEFPYQTNKVTLMQKIASLREDNKELLNISEIRDESDRNGDRVVLRLKKDTHVKHVVNALFKSTGLQNTFGANMVAIANGKPKQMPLLDIISYYVAYQRDIIYKRTKYDLEQAKEREHILSGLLIAIKNINEVIKIIKSSKTTNEAKDKLKARFALSDKQTQAIMDMRLSRLTNLEVEKLEAEIKELQALIKKLSAILGSKKLQFEVIKSEILGIKKQYKKERQTQIMKNADTLNIPSDNKPVVQETYVVSNELGNIKSIGKKYYSLAQKEFNDNSTLGEVHSKILFTTTSKNVLIFTNKANCFKVKVSSLPEARFKDKGLPAHKVIPNFTSEEKIVGIFADDITEKNLMFITKNGMVKKTKVEEYYLSKSCFQTMKLKDDDEIINIFYEEQGTLVYVTSQGMVLNSKMNDIALQGRVSQGVMGISLNKGDFIVDCEIATSKDNIAILTDAGNTKKVPVSSIEESVRNRKGVKLIPAEAGKKIIVATLNLNATLVAPVDDGFVYKEVDKISTESRTTKGKGISKKKLKLTKGYVYNI